MSPQQGHRRSGLRLAGAFHITATLDRLADLPRDVIEKDFSAARRLRPTRAVSRNSPRTCAFLQILAPPKRRFEHLAVFRSPGGNGQAVRPARVESLRELLTAESLRSPFCCNLMSGRRCEPRMYEWSVRPVLPPPTRPLQASLYCSRFHWHPDHS